MLEAMSKGCIIIAPNQENISEIISHRVNGVLYTKKKNNILGILNELIKDEQTMKKISKNAIDHTIKNNSLELFLNKEIADFKNVMKNKGN